MSYKVKAHTVSSQINPQTKQLEEIPFEVEVEIAECSRTGAAHCEFAMKVSDWSNYKQYISMLQNPEFNEQERSIIKAKIDTFRSSGNKYIDNDKNLFEDFYELFVINKNELGTSFQSDLFAISEVFNSQEVSEKFRSFFENTPAGLLAAEELKRREQEIIQSIEKDTSKAKKA